MARQGIHIPFCHREGNHRRQMVRTKVLWVMSTSPRLRCAIYTRKSSDEGLDQDFNSLDAQREACEAFVKSQASLGWKLIPTLYDDGGVSGGTLDRPALKQLLSDIKQGHVDVVVVYKIDRLTRSLTDFAKIMDVFDDPRGEEGRRPGRETSNPVSFVSVTQQFNTTTSMGRLTLNVLLSFAQFERELTAERIRDKIAASKKKGMWMGGIVPLGYKAENKKLIINKAEANTVRYLFERYLELGSVKQLSEEAKSKGLTGRTYKQKNGATRKTAPFGRGNLYHLLSNPVYTGKVRHQDTIYDGQHDAIIDQDLWDAVQARMATNTKERLSGSNIKSASILTGLIFDETGDRLSPVHAIKNGVRYRYYISNRLSNCSSAKTEGWRLPAKELEQPVLTNLKAYLTNPLKLDEQINPDDQSVSEYQSFFAAANKLARVLIKSPASGQKEILASFIHRIELQPGKLIIEVDANRLFNLLIDDETETTDTNIKRIEIHHQLRKRGVEAKLVLSDVEARQPNRDHNLIMLIAKAHLWLSKLTDGTATSIGELAAQQDENQSEISRFLPLAFLAPNIIEHILAGTHPVDLTIQKLRETSALPYNWKEQRELLGFAA